MEKSIIINNIQNRIKKINKNIKLNRYYQKKATKDKSLTANLLDKLLSRMIILVGFYVFFFIITKDNLFSLIISIQFFLLFNFIIYKINKLKISRAKETVNAQIAKNKIIKDLTNKAPYEFFEVIRLALEKCNVEGLELLLKKEIDMIGKLNGNKIGIKCFQYNEDYKVSFKEIREFFLELKELGIDEGIIITTSSFTEDVSEFMPKLKEHVKLHLIGQDKLVKMWDTAELYPSIQEIQNLILSEVAENRKKFKEYRKIALAKGKSIKYFLIGTVIYFWGRITPYEFYYRIVSYILFSLGIITVGRYIISIMKPKTEKEENEIFNNTIYKNN